MDLIGFLLLVVGVAGVAVVAALGYRSQLPARTTVGSLAVCMAVAGFGFVLFLWPSMFEDFTRSRDLRALDEHSRPLIAAIQEFEKARARPPQDLAEVVPEFLADEPTTGLSRWPRYDYFVDARRYERGWHLDVWIPKTWFDLEGSRRFQYEPDSHRDAALGATLRSGDWVYIPD
jgi:hypothetical protein